MMFFASLTSYKDIVSLVDAIYPKVAIRDGKNVLCFFAHTVLVQKQISICFGILDPGFTRGGPM